MTRHPVGLPEALLPSGRTLVMGILNVTPDSFSDGGLYLDHDAAVTRGIDMAQAGADLVDVGGESTRPGATPIPSDRERSRVLEVVRDLVGEGISVSIDTRHADVARSCIEAGAVLVNDVSAGRADVAMWPLIAEAGVPYVLMHNRGEGIAQPDLADDSRQIPPSELAHRVWREWHGRFLEALDAGLHREQVVADPGLGFAKDAATSWALTTRVTLEEFGHDARGEDVPGMNRPVLLGASRKRFLATRRDGVPRSDDSMAQRDRLTVEITEQAARAGVWCVRVHDVAPSAAAVRRLATEGTMPI